MPGFKYEVGKGFKIDADENASTATQLGSGPQVLIGNEGPNTVFIHFGGNTVTASTAQMFVLPESYALLDRNPEDDYISAICASGETATVRVMTGRGQ